MALSLDGTTGITSDGGTPVIENLDTTATGIDVTGVLTTTGNVGIGTSSPSYRVEVKGPAATAGQLSIHDGTGDTVTSGNNAGSLLFQARDSSIRTIAEIDVVHTTTNGTGAAMVFQTRVSDVLAERMRIDSSGNVLVGTTTVPSSSVSGVVVKPTGVEISAGSATGLTYLMAFINGNGTVGNINVNGSTTAYATSSDYRLKEDWQPMSGSVDRVKALNPVNFAWKVDGSRVDGFLAHEAQAIVPEAVTGTKDAMRDQEYEVTAAIEATYDEEGNELTAAVPAVMGTRTAPDYQGIDQSKLVPLLTAALQDSIAKIEALEARVTALENA